MDRRVIATAAVFAVATTGVLLGAEWNERTFPRVPSSAPRESLCDRWARTDAASHLPPGTRAIGPRASVVFRGAAVCALCRWGIGDECHVFLWDQDADHVVALAPGGMLDRLTEETGTCPNGRTNVTVRGELRSCGGFDLLSMTHFSIGFE